MNSFTRGERPSVRLPRRMVPIWVSDPMGLAKPLRMASTPATNVVATAPIPGIMTPSLPFAGWISEVLLLFGADFWRAAIEGIFLMTLNDCGQTGMFSYWASFCNLLRLNGKDER